jgi:hypothetical protein
MEHRGISKLILAAAGLLLIFVWYNGWSGANLDQLQVDYGKSARYTEEDMDSAAQVIKNRVKTWTGFTFYTLSYKGDDDSMQQLKQCNQIRPYGKFDECMVFTSSFHTPEGAADYGWNPDSDYSGWEWILARRNGGRWILVAQGHG